jgi:hypothetical protein
MAGPVDPRLGSDPAARAERPIARPKPVLGRQPSYAHRFRGAYVALAFVFWGVVAGGTVVLVRGSGDSGPSWSTWKPTDSGPSAAMEIAAHVGPEYRQSDGLQLVSVRVHRPQVLVQGQNYPVAAVAVQTLSDNPPAYSADNALVYELFGAGAGGSIATGQPSSQRLRLLRREALELALYTFKYVKSVDSVIAALPPPPKKPQTNWSVFFRKDDLKRQLHHPLLATLPSSGKELMPSGITPFESNTIDQLTNPRWFNSSYVQVRDGNVVLVLQPR